METPDAHKNSEVAIVQFEKIASSRRLNLNQLLKEHFNSKSKNDDACNKSNNVKPNTKINQ